MITEELVWNQLKELKDTMFGSPLSVVDVGLIYQVQIEQNNVHVVVTQFNRGHIYTNSLSSGVRQKILELAGIGQVSVECVWDPPWTQEMISETGKMELGMV